MDDSVKVTRAFLREVRGFCNVFAAKCDSCYVRSRENCMECVIVMRAKEIIRQIDTMKFSEEERLFVQDATIELYNRILRAVSQAGRPIQFDEMNIEGISRQRKYGLLKAMCKKGMLECTLGQNGKKIFKIRNCGNEAKTKTTK